MQVYHHRWFQRLERDSSSENQTLDVHSRLLTFHFLHSWHRPTRWVLFPGQNMPRWWLIWHCHSPAVNKPPGHHSGPSHHHKLCPTGPGGRPPPCLNRSCWRDRWPVSLEGQLRQKENIWLRVDWRIHWMKTTSNNKHNKQVFIACFQKIGILFIGQENKP